MSEIDAQIKVTRDIETPDGEWGAWEAEIFVGGSRLAKSFYGKTRDEVIAAAQEHWTGIRSNWLAPEPEPEWVKLS